MASNRDGWWLVAVISPLILLGAWMLWPDPPESMPAWISPGDTARPNRTIASQWQDPTPSAYAPQGTASDATIAEPGVLDGLREEARAFLGEGSLKPDDTFRLRHLMAIQKEPDVGLATGRLRRALAGRA